MKCNCKSVVKLYKCNKHWTEEICLAAATGCISESVFSYLVYDLLVWFNANISVNQCSCCIWRLANISMGTCLWSCKSAIPVNSAVPLWVDTVDTSEGRRVNRHTTWCTSHISVSRCLADGGRNGKSLPVCGPTVHCRRRTLLFYSVFGDIFIPFVTRIIRYVQCYCLNSRHWSVYLCLLSVRLFFRVVDVLRDIGTHPQDVYTVCLIYCIFSSPCRIPLDIGEWDS